MPAIYARPTPIQAKAFVTTVDVPLRFAKSRAVGAHVGLTPQAVNPAKSSAVAGPRNAAKP
jgi:transposase